MSRWISRETRWERKPAREPDFCGQNSLMGAIHLTRTVSTSPTKQNQTKQACLQYLETSNRRFIKRKVGRRMETEWGW